MSFETLLNLFHPFSGLACLYWKTRFWKVYFEIVFMSWDSDAYHFPENFEITEKIVLR